MKEETTWVEKLSEWISTSIMLKLITVTILMLLLLIPNSMVDSIIEERKNLSQRVTNEVSSVWANSQRIKGPVLSIPLTLRHENEDGPYYTTIHWHVLPEHLNVDGEVFPEKLNRGIYDVAVYRSSLSLKGKFKLPKEPSPENLHSINYEDAFLTVGISDLRGIESQIQVKWEGENKSVESGSNLNNFASSGINIPLNDSSLSGNFQIKIDLQGSKSLLFAPVGGETKVNLKSTWEDPKFFGAFIPDHRTVDDSGFTAEWSVLELNRNFPQSFTGSGMLSQIESSMFGVELYLSLDDYQKAKRSSKYGVMTIALTFLIFFLVEVVNRRKIHPFQYALVGLALCLFYVILVSLSEHLDFNASYAISTLTIVGLISAYGFSVLKLPKLVLLLFLSLLGIYGFMFVTLQMADYALLMGSVGLLIILAATMFFTRNIDWYSLKRKEV